jgi:hypothetical protein
LGDEAKEEEAMGSWKTAPITGCSGAALSECFVFSQSSKRGSLNPAVNPSKQQSFRGPNTIRRMTMKYVISWFERPQGSPMEYENAQKRILEVFGQWKAPANFKIEFFVVRVGEWGGHMLVDCDDPLTIHKFCSMLPAFVFEARPVITVEEAVRGELEVIAWRDGLKRK